MTTADIQAEARELRLPVLGPPRTARLIRAVADLEKMATVRELRPMPAR